MTRKELTILVIVIFFVLGSVFGGIPLWRVWQKGLSGKGQLLEASYNRQIAVQEADAKKESAKSLADAEVIRAEGVAKANIIIGESLKSNEAYLRYLWVSGLEHTNNQVIYVPTEANLPLLEAQRLNNPKE